MTNSIFSLEISPITEICADLPSSVVREIIEIISWQRQHEPNWYQHPGRTVLYQSQEFDRTIKIKGAGFYNPPNISFSGLKRTIEPVPESTLPLPPLQTAFQRDLIHVDPDRLPPYSLISVKSFPAPVGGMLLRTALNDREMFRRLNRAGVPANSPLAVFGYDRLYLDRQQMGVSVSALPEQSLAYTPYDIYLHWAIQDRASSQLGDLENLGAQICGNAQFSIANPIDRLKLVSRLGRFAGKTILEFSTKAGLYRFSGSPDNFSLRLDPRSPLYLSDVDTAGILDAIDRPQQTWEVLRNLLTALHQWLYFFLPSLADPDSGYTWELLREYDFIAELLAGFFPHADATQIQVAAAKIWAAVAPVRQQISSPIPLRGGEYLLQHHCPRPLFYFIALDAAIDLIQGSAVQQLFPAADTTAIGIHKYIAQSADRPSHQQFFATYSLETTKSLYMRNNEQIASSRYNIIG
jgi:hypothetical protein